MSLLPFLNCFSDFEWLHGNPSQALSEPGKVVLTEEKAKTYFSLDKAEEALGRELYYRDSLSLTVIGIIAKPEQLTDIFFQDFISFPTIESTWLKNNFALNDWSNTISSSQLFVKLGEGIHQSDAETQLGKASEIYKAQNEQWGFTANYKLQPLSNLHFNSELGIFDTSPWSPAHKPTLLLLLLVAGLLLIIAAINFINLETAQSFRRAKEVGVRKVLGGSKRELIFQFLTETMVLSIIAVLCALPSGRLGAQLF